MRKDSALDVFAYVLGFRPAKTVVHRLLVISLHIIGWGLFLTMPLLIYRIEILDTYFLYRELVNKVFLILLFYFHYYYLIPRFFQKKRYGKYFLTVVASLIVICVQQLVVEGVIQQQYRSKHGRAFRPGNKFFHRLAPVGKLQFPSMGAEMMSSDSGSFTHMTENLDFVETVEYHGGYNDLIKDTVLVSTARAVPAIRRAVPPFFDKPMVTIRTGGIRAGNFSIAGNLPTFRFLGTEIPLMAMPMLLMDTLTSAIIILLISGFIKLANSLLLSEKQKKILETERLNAELNFLKLQINPHFLFNTLNSIYSQAHLKSEQTEYSILKFSQIMRYVLYDTGTEKISLRKDFEYISNYIDLQKLRLSKNVTVNFQVTGNTDQLLIAPLLLITYIENAFKHGVSYSIPSEIRISIGVTGNTLLLTVSNAITTSRQTGHEGVGLINARRRLDVLYPGRYMLDVVDNKSLYIVNLKIELDHEN